MSEKPVLIAGGGIGGLAAALAFLARDRGDVDLVAQILAYPMIDDRSGERAHRDDPGFRLWDRRSNNWGWSAYLADADPDVAVPARLSSDAREALKLRLRQAVDAHPRWSVSDQSATPRREPSMMPLTSRVAGPLFMPLV